MRKSGFVLAILLISTLTAVAVIPQPTEVEAWGLVTHMFIASEAAHAITNATWKAVFDFYTPELLTGSTTPDQAWQDWDNHLYYPHNKTHNAPTAAARWYNYTRDNFTAGNWEAGFFSMGVMSHYFADPHIPVHTDVYWAGHSAYEGDINDNLASLTIGTLAEAPATNVSQMVVDGATYSHQFYDTVVDAYPYASSEALMANSTIKSFTESCLTKAINGCLSLFYNLTQYVEPPDVSVTYNYVALVDYAHSNDYTDLADQLTSLNQTLSREGFEMRKQTTAFTAGDLIGVDLLIATCGLDAYTAAELTAISDWAATGNRSVILTGRGDFSIYTDVARPNQVLEAIGSNIRVNDDNVYMQGTYSPWYNDLYTIPAAGDTLNLTFDVDSFTMYSPTSLYFLDDVPILPVIPADVTAYQTDQTAPEPTVVYDDVIDGSYGTQIPLAAVEEIGNLRLLVTGTTFFSDFDYGKTDLFDNIVFLENFLHWAVGNRSEFNVPLVDEVGPRIGDIAWNPLQPIEGESISVQVTVTDPSGVSHVFVRWVEYTTLVSFQLDEFPGSKYNLTLPWPTSGSETFWFVANDTVGNIATRASFTIDWIPFTVPTIDDQPDLDYVLGDTGNTITWTPSDAYPVSYLVLLNGSEYDSGEWDGSSITINIDGLALGSHNFTVIVYSFAGGSATDQVIVTVVEPTTTTTTTETSTTTSTSPPTTPPPPPPDYMTMIILGAIGGIAILALVMVIFRRR